VKKPRRGIATARPRAPSTLPHLREIFDLLRRGRHICEADAEYYWALKDLFEKYASFFDQLGFSLVAHGRGFYSFHEVVTFSGRSRRMAVFMFILVEHLADRGDSIEETLLSRLFRIDELPHFHSDRYRGYMKEADIAGDSELANVLRGMELLGFLKREDDGSFRFQRPVYRFLDLCLEILNDDEPAGTEDSDPAGGERAGDPIEPVEAEELP
jgi:hypothetical protein